MEISELKRIIKEIKEKEEKGERLGEREKAIKITAERIHKEKKYKPINKLEIFYIVAVLITTTLAIITREITITLDAILILIIYIVQRETWAIKWKE